MPAGPEDTNGHRARGRELLARTGSLARLPAHLIRVLPKVGTPLGGSSVRALSHYAAVQVPGVEVRWHRAPLSCPGAQSRGKELNYLLLPWPLRVRGSDFRPVPGPLRKLANDPFGFFEFAPSEPLDLDLVDRMLVAARDQAKTVDIVILPESAVERGELDDLEALLGRHASILADDPGSATGGNPPLEAVPVAVHESRPGQPASDRLARAVLRSALEQCQTRQALAGGRI